MGDAASSLNYYDRALQDASLPTARRLDILMRAGNVHLAAGQAARAAARYDEALTLAQEPLTISAIYLFAGRGYAGANQMDLAAARWTSAITETPDQMYAPQALGELTNRNLPVDDFQRGLVQYHAGDYNAAIEAFRRNLSSAAPRAGDAHYYIGKAYAALGAYSQAIAEYDGVIKMQPKDKRAPDAFMAQAEAYEAIGEVDQSVIAYKSLATQFPDDALADKALLQAGLILEQLNRHREAAAVFEQLQAQYATRETAPEALFRAGLDYYRLQDAPMATARWQSLVETYPLSPYLTSGLYWLGKAAMERGQTDKATNFWTQAAAQTERVKQPFRFSYYAWRAKQALEPPASPGDRRLYDLTRYAMGSPAERAAFEKWLESWTKAPLASPGNLDASIRENVHFRRGEEWLRLGRIADARGEFAELIDEHQDDVPGLYALAIYFQDVTLYALSGLSADRIALLAQNAGATRAPRFLQTLRYPTYYADLVVAESKANHIDPLFEFATIRLESRYDTWVTGPFGEKGLAQLEEYTARSSAEALNMKDFNLDQLYRPVVNLHMSAWLFAQNSRQLNDPIYAFAAYNAGLPRALGWVGNDVDLAVEEFDIPLTRLYVHMAYGYWRQYLDLYH
jgi:soluble lytic murein transglycosylase